MAERVKPGHMVAVIDFAAATIAEVAAHMEVSTAFEHLIFREAEIGALWSLTGFALRESSEKEAIARLREALLDAHELIASRKPLQAAERLRPFTGPSDSGFH